MAGTAHGDTTNSPNRFTLGARLPFNISAKFGGSGGFSLPSNPGPSTGGATDRFYDDGYVGLDADGNAGGVTWFWGYENPSQLDGDLMRLSSSSAGSAGSVRAGEDEPALGFETSWLRELYRNQRVSAGLKLAFNYTEVEISDSRPLRAPVTRLTDVYSLGGIVPPGQGNSSGWQYQATRDQGLYNEAPVVDDVPVRREVEPNAGTALTTGNREMAANIFGFKLGPWIELPVTRRISLQAGGGVAWAVVDSWFRYNESTSIEGVGVVTERGHTRDSDPIAGAYAEAGVSFSLTPGVGLFVSGEFQTLSRFVQGESGHKATLNLGQTWSLQTGVSFSF